VEAEATLCRSYDTELSWNANQDYEEDRTAEQLDDIADWIEGVEEREKAGTERYKRVGVAVLQGELHCIAFWAGWTLDAGGFVPAAGCCPSLRGGNLV
jgi:hypothetical protein